MVKICTQAVSEAVKLAETDSSSPFHTSILVLPKLTNFMDYLDVTEVVERLLEEEGEVHTASMLKNHIIFYNIYRYR